MPIIRSSSITGSFLTFLVDIKSDADHKSEFGSVKINGEDIILLTGVSIGYEWAVILIAKSLSVTSPIGRFFSKITIAPTPASSIIFAASVAVTEESTETTDLLMTSFTQVFCCSGSGEFNDRFNQM